MAANTFPVANPDSNVTSQNALITTDVIANDTDVDATDILSLVAPVEIADATLDFSLDQNPNGPWIYYSSDDTVRDGDYRLLAEAAPLDTPGGAVVWHADTTPTAIRPFVGVKNSNFSGVGSWANGELAIHPGRSARALGAGLVVVTYVVEADGTADIDFDLTLALSGDVLWFVELNDGSQTLASGRMAGNGDSASIDLDSVSVVAGDRINLVIDSNGSVGRDLIRVLRGQITAPQAPVATMTLDSDNSVIPVGDSTVTQSGNEITFDPGTDFDFLAAGQTATVVIGYTVSDNNGATDDSELTITVTGTNDAPVAVADTNQTTENLSVSTDVVANDTDVDVGDTLTLVAGSRIRSITRDSDSSSIAVFNANLSRLGNEILFDPGTALDSLATGETATVVVDYSVADTACTAQLLEVSGEVTTPNAFSFDMVIDLSSPVTGGGGTASAVFGNAIQSFSIDGTELSPAENEIVFVQQGSRDILSISFGDPLGQRFDLSGILPAAYFGRGPFQLDRIASLRLNDFTNTPSISGPSAFGDITELSQNIVFDCGDGPPQTDSSTLTISVTGTNDSPRPVPDSSSTTENAAVTTDVIVNDTDVDITDVLSLGPGASLNSMTLDSSGAAIPFGDAAVTQAGNEITFDPGSSLDLIPEFETATVVIGYGVEDDDASPLSANSMLTITVEGANDAPMAVADTNATTEEAAVTTDVTLNDVDVDVADVLTVQPGINITSMTLDSDSSIIPINDASVELNGNEITFDPGTDFTFLANDESATVLIDYTVSDSPCNNFAQLLEISGSATSPDSFDFSIVVDLSSQITRSGGTAAAIFEGAIQSFTIDGNPLSPDSGSNEVVFVRQGSRDILQLSFGDFVDFSGILPGTYFGAGPYSLDQLTNLSLGDFTNVPSISAPTAFGDVTELTPVLGPECAVTPLSDSSELAITVTGVNATPVPSIAGISETRVEGTPINVIGAATDADGSNDTLTFTYDVLKNGDAFATGAGVDLTDFSFTPDDDGTYEIVLTVSDAVGDSATVSEEIQVSNVAPVIDLGEDCVIHEGESVTLDLTLISDPGDDTVSEVTVDWGDNTVETFTTLEEVTHTYVDGTAEFTITVTLVDEDGAWTGANSNSVPQYLANVNSLSSNLIARYELDGDVDDSVGTADGIVVGTAGFTQGLVGDAIRSDNGSYGHVQPPIAYVPGNDTFSTSLHFNFSEAIAPLSWVPLIVFQQSDFNEGALFWVTTTNVPGDTLEVIVHGGPKGSSDFQVVTAVFEESLFNDWHQAGYRIDRGLGTVSLFLDGEQVADSALTVSSLDPTKGLFIGQFDFTFGRNGHPRFVGGIGAIDDVLLFDTALTEEQYASISLTGANPFAKNVTVLNAPPVANPDTAVTTEDMLVTSDVIANDTDPGVDDVLSLGPGVSITSATLDSDNSAIPLGDAIVSQSGNAITFDPGTDFDFLAVGETATVVIDYFVSDDEAATDESKLTITVTGSNDAPVATPDLNVTTENAAVTTDVIGNDTDLDATDVLSLLAGSTSFADATLDFSLAQNPNGPWAYYSSDDTVRDGDYRLLAETAPLDVTGGGEIVWHADTTPTAIRPFVGVKTFNFPGVGSWANGELAIHPGRSGRAGGAGLVVLSYTVPSDGLAEIDFDLRLALGGNVSWFVELNDGSQTLASGSMVGNGNSATIDLDSVPVAAGERINLVIDSNGSVGRDLVRVLQAQIAVTGDPQVTMTLDSDNSTIPVGDSSVTQNGNEITFDPGTDFDFLSAGETATVVVSYAVSDGNGGTDNSTLTITVEGVNDQPAISVVNGAVAVDEGSAATNSGMFSDVDATNVLSLDASVGMASDNGDGTWTWTYGETDDDLATTVTVEVTDTFGGFDSVSFALDVNNVAPQNVDAGADQIVAEGDTVSVSGSFADPGSADTHTEVWSVIASNGQMIADGLGSSFSFTPVDNGTYTLTYTVTDDDNGVTSDDLVITATNSEPENLAVESDATLTSKGSLSADLVVTNLGEASAGYQNSYGYYLKDSHGRPTTGEIIWADMQASVGQFEILSGVDSSVVGFFIVPNGLAENPTLTDGTTVSFLQDSHGDWFASANGAALSGTGADVYFDQKSLNADNKDHVSDGNGSFGWGWGSSQQDSVLGNQFWEDQFRLGDRDYDDVRVNVTRSANVTVSGTFDDNGIADQHSVMIAWGDGTQTELLPPDPAIDQANNSFSFTHNYLTGGIFDVDVSVTDDDGASVTNSTQSVVSGVRLASGGELQIIGTAGNDEVEVDTQGGSWSWFGSTPDNEIVVDTEFAGFGHDSFVFPLADVNKIRVVMCEGDDNVDVKHRVHVSTTILGNAGNDVIRGGSGVDSVFGGGGADHIYGNGGNDYVRAGGGDDRVWGGAGDDILNGDNGSDRIHGGNGKDLLIGGNGADKVWGDRGEDIVIGGKVTLNKSAIQAVHALWLNGTSWNDRVASVSAPGQLEAGVNVLNDSHKDELRGSWGRDLFFAQLAGANKDAVKDKWFNEQVIALT